MDKVMLGRTGLRVARLGFGGIPIQRLEFGAAVRLVREAIDNGIEFIDTARAYSDSERKIGAALAGRRRDRVVIATKAHGLDAATMAANIEASLSELRCGWIDLYQMHSLDNWERFRQATGPGGAMRALVAAKLAGKVRHIGVSSHSLDFLERLLAEAPNAFETIQVPLNFVGDEAGARLLGPARAAGVGFIAMKPMGGGALERPDLALRYVLQFDGVVAIPGIETRSELRQNLRLARCPRPPAGSELRDLAALRRRLGRMFCRKCDYCRPCPADIQISLALGAETLVRRFNRQTLAGWCLDVMRKAAACRKCGACEKRCPYRLPIRRLLAEKVAFFRKAVAEMGIEWGGN